MRDNHVLIGQPDLEGGIGQRLNHFAFKFNYIIFRQNNPSLPCMMSVLQTIS
jgi:hypothetical protein